VRADSPAANAGLRPGDVILEIDRKKIRGIKDYETALRNARDEKGLLLLIKRGQGNLYIVLKKKPQ
ncbi:MAG: PDZ domain-containing protein, partial [Deltaproteobacteria bacterium]|nr:PDZ domain-containing protein [Deltaproteobacteria bacterium]